jgi:hypothetical protein
MYMDESKESSLREMEKLMDLEEGTLKNNFISLDSLSCCKVISNIMQEITRGVAVSPASIRRGRRGDMIRDYVTHIISTLGDLRDLFLEDHTENEHRRKHIN